jgi:hypothetical protein
MPNGNGSNDAGAGATTTAQRKRGAQSDVFGAPRVRIYPPCPSSGSEGRFCAFRARAGTRARVYGRLSAARAGSAARCPCRIRWCTWSGPRDGGRVNHIGCPRAGHTSGRKTWVRFRERGGKESQRDLRTKLNLRCNPLHEKVWRVRLYPQPFANERGENATNCTQ